MLQEFVLLSFGKKDYYYPGLRGFPYYLFLFGNLGRKALIEAPSREKRTPLAKIVVVSFAAAQAVVKIVANLTFMLAQHLTAVKDVILF